MRVEMERKLAAAESERQQLLEKMSELDGGRAAAEAEAERKLAEAKEARIEHLKNSAMRRIANQGLIKGWGALVEQYEESKMMPRQ